MCYNFFIPPTKQGLSIGKCMHKPMYMSGLFSKISLFSYIKDIFFSCFSQSFLLLPVKVIAGEKLQGKNFFAT
jgi:hypothetical protein